MHTELPSDTILDTVRMRDVLAGLADWKGKISRMLGTGELVSLRRGLYTSRRDLDPRCFAGPIYGPSYMSFETALAWHGMIPEGVAEILSATTKRPAGFENDFGRFRYDASLTNHEIRGEYSQGRPSGGYFIFVDHRCHCLPATEAVAQLVER